MKPRIRARGGCESCRKRHAKCDDKKPSCTSCETLRVRCRRQDKLTFRNITRVHSARSPESTLEFASDQYWIDIPERLCFVRSVSENEPTIGPDDTITAADDDRSPGVLSTEAETTSIKTPVEEYQTRIDDSPHHRVSPSSQSLSVPAAAPLCLPSEETAFLFRYFITSMSSWFDINDWNRTCTREIIKRSLSSDLLRKAIYALSSRQLANLKQFDLDKADRYHDDCMEELIPSLTEPAVLMDDNMFAATVILRTKEEMEAYLVDHEIYLLGIKAFTNSEHFEHQLNPFREATYWIALRQEIHSVLLRQRPPGVNLNVSFTQKLTNLSSDTIWTKACVLNLAKILTFCFDDKQKSKAEFEKLMAITVRLAENIPQEYQPLYYCEANGERGNPFPQVWLLNDTAVHSLQYLTFSKMLLFCFNPTIPQVGPGSHSFARKNQENIVEQLRYLCGIGLSHPDFGPGMFLTCVGISLSGDRVTSRAERDCLLDILGQTQTKHGWQSTTIQRELLESWGGER